MKKSGKTKDFSNLKKQVKLTPGKLVGAFRRNFNFTQAELAKVTGIGETNLSAIENDHVEIGIKRAVLIAEVFGIDPSLILFPKDYVAEHYAAEIKPIQRAIKKLWLKKSNAG